MSDMQPGPKTCLRAWDWSRHRLPLAIALLGLALLPWSGVTFKFVRNLLHKLPVDSLFSTATEVPTWPVWLFIVIIIFRMDRPRARYVPYMLVGLLATSAINTPMKQITGRSRPEWSIALSNKKFKTLQQLNQSATEYQFPMEKIDHWYGLAMPRPFFIDRYASFPSGHSAAVFAMAAFFCVLYPRMRNVWLATAILCGLARVYDQRHYVEDVMVGGTIGWMAAHWAFSWHWPLRLGDRLTGITAEPAAVSQPAPEPLAAPAGGE